MTEQPDLPTVGGAVRARVAPSLGKGRVAWLARTDAGVHADINVGSLWWRSAEDVPADLLTDGVDLGAMRVVPADIKRFFVRGLARQKRYVYRVQHGMNDEAAVAFEARCGLPGRRAGQAVTTTEARTLQVAGRLDVGRMCEAMALFVGTQDFNTFRAPVYMTSSTIKTVARSELVVVDNTHLELIIEGDAFLRQMVRMLVAAVLEVGRGERDLHTLAADLASCNPRRGAWPAPPRGLTLAALDLPQTPLGPAGWTTLASLNATVRQEVK